MSKMKTVLRGGASLVTYQPLFSPDGKYLFCCCGDTVKVFSLASGECVHNLTKHKQLVTSIKLHPRNPLKILTCSLDGSVIEWDYTDGVAVKVHKVNFPIHGMLVPRQNIIQGKKELQIYAIKQTPKQGYQLVQLTLHHHQNTASSAKAIVDHVTGSEKMIGLGSDDEYIVSLLPKTMKIYSFKTQQNEKHTLPSSDPKLYGKFTCVACHPREYCIATGLTSGRICLWWNFVNLKHVVTTYHHWHYLPVTDLRFTQEGSYLLSGGHECVLVRWQNNMQHKDFMPRLGAPINHVTCSHDNTMYVTSHTDNVIQVMTHTLKREQNFQGLAKGHLGHPTKNPIPTGLLVDPRTKALVLNGKPGHLQFYLMHLEKHLYNLDIVGQNYISPPDLDKPIVVTEVEHAAFDQEGDWLVTVERRDDGETAMEMRLKFWMYDKKSQGYILNTNVDLPHNQPINTLKLRPKSLEDAAPMAVTTSDDRKFKLWCLVDDTDIYRKTVCWNCDSVGYYRDYPARAADFSKDGSLLAVSFKLTLTLWDPDSNALRTRLDCLTGTAIKHVLFGQEESSHLLVATTETNLIVWNILTCTVYWSIPLSISVLICNPGTDYMAAFTKEKTLFVFRPQHSSPDYTQQAISKHPVVHAVFLPREKPVESDITWHQQTQLYFLDKKQSLLSLITEEEEALALPDKVVPMQQNLPQTPYSLLMSRERKTGVEEVESNVIMGTKGEPGAVILNQLLHTPAHVLPPINTLCKDFVTALLISKSGSRKPILQGQDDDSSESDLEESDDSDMDTETVSQTKETYTQETAVDSSQTDAAQLETDKLSYFLPNEFSWMKSVFSC
ncbi:WD repeat-containing protein 75-like [Lineus longissimus]|uniref:WD repeat-containing protein 75-like n=1 Tax=Lineus longissimus TaxID=88925 RepID=UPI002B4DC6EA